MLNNRFFLFLPAEKKVYSNLWPVVMRGCLSLDREAMTEFTMTNYYSTAGSTALVKVEVWALSDLDVEVGGAGWGVAVGLALQRHVVSLDDGSLGHNLQANPLTRI